MSEPAAIIASLVDVRNIAEHSSVVLKIHVPQERALEVIAAFGWPTGANPVAVAIARLNTDVSPQKLIEALGGAGSTESLSDWYQKNPMDGPLGSEEGEASREKYSPTKKERREFCILPFTTQAVLKSTDEKFASWLDAMPGQDCAHFIRKRCEVTSRSQIIKGTPAGDLWMALLRSYEEHH